MFFTPLIAAVVIGSFWTGVGVTAAASGNSWFDRPARSNIVITAEPAFGDPGHVARCEARFRSYDINTDSYLGFDGDWHRCRL